MAIARIHAPSSPRRGEIIEIQALIAHPMETGYRPGPDGQVLPRDLIRRFSCHYNGALVFSCELYPAVAANPYLAFALRAQDSGTLRLQWEGDNGFSQTETLALNVSG